MSILRILSTNITQTFIAPVTRVHASPYRTPCAPKAQSNTLKKFKQENNNEAQVLNTGRTHSLLTDRKMFVSVTSLATAFYPGVF
jgi:hypothetical protein